MVQLQSQIKFIESHIPYICSCVLPVKLTLIKKTCSCYSWQCFKYGCYRKTLQILKFNTKFNPTPFLNIEYRFNMVTSPPLVPEGCCTIINYTQKKCFHRTLWCNSEVDLLDRKVMSSHQSMFFKVTVAFTSFLFLAFDQQIISYLTPVGYL